MKARSRSHWNLKTDVTVRPSLLVSYSFPLSSVKRECIGYISIICSGSLFTQFVRLSTSDLWHQINQWINEKKKKRREGKVIRGWLKMLLLIWNIYILIIFYCTPWVIYRALKYLKCPTFILVTRYSWIIILIFLDRNQ